MEIERRFLVNSLDGIDLLKYKSKKIIQNYLYSDKFTSIRKRHIIVNDENKYIYTIKTGRKKLSVNEIEKEITEEEYESLKINENNNTIEKTRYLIPYKDELVIELDIFEGSYKGIVFAEIEFESEEQAQNTSLPLWFGKELTSKITNGMMARMNVDDVKILIEGYKD